MQSVQKSGYPPQSSHVAGVIFDALKSYRLRMPLHAVLRTEERLAELRKIPAGAIVTLTSEVHASGMVDVIHADTLYTVLFSDVCERGDPVA